MVSSLEARESPPPADRGADKRLLRGARSRQVVLDKAVDIASLEGLGGLSFGGLAVESGMSKAGIQTLFGSKETLQLATVDHARTMFVDFVTRPSLAVERGADRVRALIERWIVYAERPLFAGGCFQAANLADFDSRPGPVRDALARNQQAWIDTLSAELAHAVAEHEIAALDPDLAAFQLDAVLRSANTALQLGDRTVIDKIRRIVDGILAPPAPAG